MSSYVLGVFVCILRPFRFFGYSFKLFKKLTNKACLIIVLLLNFLTFQGRSLTPLMFFKSTLLNPPRSFKANLIS